MDFLEDSSSEKIMVFRKDSQWALSWCREDQPSPQSLSCCWVQSYKQAYVLQNLFQADFKPSDSIII